MKLPANAPQTESPGREKKRKTVSLSELNLSKNRKSAVKEGDKKGKTRTNKQGLSSKRTTKSTK